MTRNEILELLYQTRTLIDGHFVDADGRHSARCLRPAKVLQYAPFNRRLSYEIVRHFLELDLHVVIAPTTGAIPAAVEVGRQLEARTVFFEERDGATGLYRGFELHEGERALIVADMLDDASDLNAIVATIRNANARLIGIGAIIDARASDRAFNVKNVAAIRLDAESYSSDCPLCAAGAEFSPLPSLAFG